MVNPVTVVAWPFASNVPFELVNVPFMTTPFVISWSVPAPEWTILLNVLPAPVPPEAHVWVPAAPLKVTVPEPGVNVPLVLVQLPVRPRALDPASSVPFVSVTAPFI